MRLLIPRAVMCKTIGERHASACRSGSRHLLGQLCEIHFGSVLNQQGN